jgi:NTE family protein
MSKKKLKIGLALGGGGALGMAHVGVLEILEENGIHIDMIAGTSMGAIVGAAYASGVKTEEMREFVNKIRTLDLVDFKLQKGAVFSGASAEKWIANCVKSNTFEELNMPFACTACDLLNGELVVLNSGDLIKSVRASMSVPAIFKPVELDGRYLIDGGVVCNVPADIVKNMGADIVISVNVMGDYKLDKKPTSAILTVLDTIFLQQSIITKNSITKKNTDIYIDLELGIKNQQIFEKDHTILYINKARNITEKLMPRIKKLIEKKMKELE